LRRRINALLGKDKVKDPKRGAIIITHTGYILDFVNADKGYIVFDGNLVCRGNPRDILSEIKKYGYRRRGMDKHDISFSDTARQKGKGKRPFRPGYRP
jgi:Fe-S cluster assembly ATPase SufC